LPDRIIAHGADLGPETNPVPQAEAEGADRQALMAHDGHESGDLGQWQQLGGVHELRTGAECIKPKNIDPVFLGVPNQIPAYANKASTQVRTDGHRIF
jgi:hypothetical protein